MAGSWSVIVSLPAFQFVRCRWYVRLPIWFRFLWQASGISLNIQPSHPDRCGGLGFLSTADVQSLADLGGSYDMARAMRPTPVSMDDLVSFTAVTLLPLLPLMLAALPLEQIMKRLMGVLF